jgi:hypothetical protein
MLLRKALRGSPGDTKPREASGPISDNDSSEILDTCVMKHLLDHGYYLRSVLPRAERMCSSTGFPRSDSNTCCIGRCVDGQPWFVHTAALSSTMRWVGSGS